FGLARGVIVDLHDDVAALLQWAAHAVAQHLRRAAGRPAPDRAARQEAGPAEAAVTRPGVGRVFLAGDAARVEKEDRMVHGAAVAGPEFHCIDELVFRRA